MEDSPMRQLQGLACVLIAAGAFSRACLSASPGATKTRAVQLPRPATAPTPAQIDRNGVLILVRSTPLALDQANQTGNYTVLRDLGSPQFQPATLPPAASMTSSSASARKPSICRASRSSIRS
jgi:hypothetical protein